MFLNKYIEQFFSGHERSVKAKKNIVFLFFLKGISIIVSFLLVPMTLHYLNPTQYGIWLTLSSIIGWVAFFDIGLGNGLRNKFAEAIANDDAILAKAYVSTTYFLITFIILIAFILFLFFNQFLDWAAILNTSESMRNELRLLSIVLFAFFGLRFIFGLIGTILIADQQPAFANMIEVTGSILSLIFTFLLVRYTMGSLLLLGAVIGLSTTITPIIASIKLFKTRYHDVSPNWKAFKIIHTKDLLNLGLKFFFLQIGSLIVFSTSNIIITQVFSPTDVVPYNIAFKYFSIASLLFTILLTPFWSAYTEAYENKDIPWIHRSIKTLEKIWILLVIAVVMMIFGADYFYRLWVGKIIQVPFLLSITIGIYILETTWCNIFVNFINGTGKVRLQLLAAFLASIINVPLAIILAHYYGIVGVALAPCILLLPLCIVWPIQTRKILLNKANGIWGK